MSRQARPAIVATTRPIPLAGGKVEVLGRKPRLLMRVKTHCREDRRAFLFACKRLGIDAIRLEGVDGDPWGYQTWFDCAGTADAIDELNDMDCVAESKFAMSLRVPVLATGSGAEKPFRRPAGKDEAGKKNSGIYTPVRGEELNEFVPADLR